MHSKRATTCRTSSAITRCPPTCRRFSTRTNSPRLTTRSARSNTCANVLGSVKGMRVLGVDPGLTRCGIGIVDVAANRRATLVYVGVVQTPPAMALEQRLLAVSRGIRAALEQHRPTAMAVERVFAQHNLRTVMGTAQASGIALALGA